MSQYEIEISPTSKVVIFQGNLKKAPQLNKRGRKKWKERFCVLKANKTLVCFKSKKALDSSKAPKKVIDLRECINLEVGLEYKDQQHIFSLGTFKRTFFFGAPSDALMLQWVDSIEKVKNATDGERVKLLDIGLRRSPVRAVTKMKTSQSLSKLAALSSSIPNISQIGSQPVGGLRPSQLKKTNREQLLVHEVRSPSLPPCSSMESSNSLKSCTSISSTETSPSHMKSFKDGKESFDEEPPSRHRVGHYYVNVSPRPPTGRKCSKAAPTQVKSKYSPIDMRRHGTPEGVSQPRSSVPPELNQKVPPPRLAARMRKGSVGNEETNPFSVLMQRERVQSIQEKLCVPADSSDKNNETITVQKPLAHGMKRSFRYRRIALKKEKPLLINVEEEPSSDDDEEIEEEEKVERERVYCKKELAKSSPNLTEIGQSRSSGRSACSKTQGGRFPFAHNATYPQTNYSKITVVGVKVQNCTKSSILKDGLLKQERPTSPKAARHPICLRNSNSEGTLIRSTENANLNMSANDDSDQLILPDRHPSDTFPSCDTVSISSLDDILVDPPEMFDDPMSSQPEKEDGSNVNALQDVIESCQDETVNRNSTESSDTGYNSSPTYNKKKNVDTLVEQKWNQDKTPDLLQEKSYVCVPMVFYSKNVWKPKGRGKGLLGLQVCLVEQKSNVLEDLMSLKELEGYSLIECEHGLSTMKTPAGDTLVVETSLEDLEFGFSVVKSTQKDLFNRRVREFNFEVRNLFSSNRKPFSCEVHIKHASEVIVLPVEVV